MPAHIKVKTAYIRSTPCLHIYMVKTAYIRSTCLHMYKVKTVHANIYGLSANGMRSNKAILLTLDGGSLPISGYNFVCVKSGRRSFQNSSIFKLLLNSICPNNLTFVFTLLRFIIICRLHGACHFL